MFNISVYPRLFFVALFCLVALCNCSAPGASKGTHPPESNSNVEYPVNFNNTALGRQIRQDYADRSYGSVSINSVWIEGYYGNYDGCVVVKINDGGPYTFGPGYEIIVGDTYFGFGTGYTPIAWKGGGVL